MLPEITSPTFEVKLLSRDKPVKFRPFLVREQKLLMMASESKSYEEIAGTLKQIAKNCLLDEVDVDNLPLVDLEILFLNFRARSMGEIITAQFKCKNVVENKECGMLIEVPINLLEVDVVNKDIDRKIMVTDNIGIQMKIPTFEFVYRMLDEESRVEDPEREFKAAAENIELIFDNESVYYAKDTSPEELLKFVFSMPQDKYAKIEEYFDRLPTIRKEIDKNCPKCGYQHKFVLEGLNDFFI